MIPEWLERLVYATGTTQVRFLTPSETVAFIKSDTDGYVKNLTRMDLIARGAASPRAYMDACATAALRTHVTSDGQKTLTKAAKLADAFFRDKVTEIDGATVARMPWKIAFVAGKTYENGLPHTRADIIFLSPSLLADRELIQTLIHEKIHVYQRAHPMQMKHWLVKQDYKPTGRVNDRGQESNIRSNPDIGDTYYSKNREGNASMGPATYTSSEPNGISDVRHGGASEHPFEKMAYDIAAKY